MFIYYSITRVLIIVIVVKFKSEQYIGSESSGFVEVVVIISEGLSAIPFNVMVTLNVSEAKQSAKGEGYIIYKLSKL